MFPKKEKYDPKVYIPNGAKLNVNCNDMDIPKTHYEKRKLVFDRESIKKIDKGRHSRNG